MSDLLPWFAARLLLEREIVEPHSDVTSLFEERLILIYSPGGEEAAAKKARKLGKAAFESYENADGETVQWVFKEVLDIVQLNDATIGDGTEVYYHFLKPEEVEQVRESLKPGSLA